MMSALGILKTVKYNQNKTEMIVYKSIKYVVFYGKSNVLELKMALNIMQIYQSLRPIKMQIWFVEKYITKYVAQLHLFQTSHYLVSI